MPCLGALYVGGLHVVYLWVGKLLKKSAVVWRAKMPKPPKIVIKSMFLALQHFVLMLFSQNSQNFDKKMEKPVQSGKSCFYRMYVMNIGHLTETIYEFWPFFFHHEVPLMIFFSNFPIIEFFWLWYCLGLQIFCFP